MLRLFGVITAVLFGLSFHLGKRDRRKGSHNQKSHGSWSKGSPFSSKRAFGRSAGKGVTKKGTRVAFAAPQPKNKTQGRGAGRTLRGGVVTGVKKDSGSLRVKSGRNNLIIPKHELVSTKRAKTLKKVKRGRLR